MKIIRTLCIVSTLALVVFAMHMHETWALVSLSIIYAAFVIADVLVDIRDIIRR